MNRDNLDSLMNKFHKLISSYMYEKRIDSYNDNASVKLFISLETIEEIHAALIGTLYEFVDERISQGDITADNAIKICDSSNHRIVSMINREYKEDI